MPIFTCLLPQPGGVTVHMSSRTRWTVKTLEDALWDFYPSRNDVEAYLGTHFYYMTEKAIRLSSLRAEGFAIRAFVLG